MSEALQSPSSTPLESERFQFSLRSIFRLTTICAALFALVSAVGPVVVGYAVLIILYAMLPVLIVMILARVIARMPWGAKVTLATAAGLLITWQMGIAAFTGMSMFAVTISPLILASMPGRVFHSLRRQSPDRSTCFVLALALGIFAAAVTSMVLDAW